MNRRAVAIGLAAVFVVSAVTAVVLAVTGGGDGDEVAGPTTTSTTTEPLNATAKRLVDRLADARKHPFHLVYSGRLSAVPEAGTVTVEIWWKGDLARQSIVAAGPAQRQEQASFVLPGGNVLCQKPQDGAWVCQRAASVATAAGRPGGLIDALVSQLNGKDVTESPVKVGDTQADCYTLGTAQGDVLCLRDDGVPVKFTLSGSELLLTDVDTKVDDKAFEPPAKPTEISVPATTTTTGG